MQQSPCDSVAPMKTHGKKEHTKGFATRLEQSLEKRKKKASATVLEREFNLRWRGDPVSSHAARKWLKGMSVPTQDKLQVLARWLDVPEDWLRWGIDPADDITTRIDTGLAAAPLTAAQKRAAFNHEESSLQQDWRMLDARNRAVVRSIMDVLLREQRQHQRSVPLLPAPEEP